MELELAGKVALVTGAGRGIGAQIALSLAREGMRVMVCSRTQSDLEHVVQEITLANGVAHWVTADVATESGCAHAVAETLRVMGRIDVLVNNAGGSLGSGTFDRATSAQWTAVMDLNLMSAVWCSQHAVAWMKDNGGGCIVHVSSVCGREYCSTGPYTSAKAAMVGLGKEMAVDLAKFNIRVNTVAPGSVMFPGGSWDKRQKDNPDRIAKMVEEHLPFKRFGMPEEIASVVTFLCSRHASWVSGACIPVDGAQGRAF